MCVGKCIQEQFSTLSLLRHSICLKANHVRIIMYQEIKREFKTKQNTEHRFNNDTTQAYFVDIYQMNWKPSNSNGTAKLNILSLPLLMKSIHSMDTHISSGSRKKCALFFFSGIFDKLINFTYKITFGILSISIHIYGVHICAHCLWFQFITSFLRIRYNFSLF